MYINSKNKYETIQHYILSSLKLITIWYYSVLNPNKSDEILNLHLDNNSEFTISCGSILTLLTVFYISYFVPCKISLETYNGKKSMTNQTFQKYSYNDILSSSSKVLINLSIMYGKLLKYTCIRLIIGIGFQTEAENKKTNKPLHVIMNPFQNNLPNNLLDFVNDSNQYDISFPYLGNSLPIKLQGILIEKKHLIREIIRLAPYDKESEIILIRVQSYSKTIQKQSKIADHKEILLLHTYKMKDITQNVIDYHKLIFKFQSFKNKVLQDLNYLIDSHDTSRIENAYDITKYIQNKKTIMNGINFSINHLRSMVHNSYGGQEVYDISILKDYIPIVLLSFQYNLEIAQISNQSLIGPINQQMPDIIRDMNAFIMNYYTGKESFTKKCYFPKTSFYANRQINTQLGPTFLSLRDNKLSETLSFLKFQDNPMTILGFVNENEYILPNTININPYVTIPTNLTIQQQKACQKFVKDVHDLLGLDDQLTGFMAIISSAKNIDSKMINYYQWYLTGAAGTGKSFLLKLLIQYFKLIYFLNVHVIAFTKIAADHVDGVTLHSFFQLNPNLPLNVDSYISFLYQSQQSKLLNKLMNVKVLIIDEVSTISSLLISFIDEVFKKINNSLNSFGGIYIILCGDHFQTPPIFSKEIINDGFFFESNAFLNG